MTFIVVFIIYQFIFIRDYRSLNNNKKQRSVKPRKKPVEVKLLESLKVDISKLKYSKVLNSVALVSSLDISIIITIACLSNIGLIQIAIAIVIIIPIIYFSYYLLALYYKRKIRLNKDIPEDSNKEKTRNKKKKSERND